MIEREIQTLKISELQVPDEYQRSMDIKRAKKIASEFDVSKLDLITVSERNGSYYVVDGLHRISAMKILGMRECECVIIRGASLEGEAKRFYTQNENRRQLTAYDVFKAKLAAKNPAAVEIKEILERNGYEIVHGGYAGRKLQSVTALEYIYSKYSPSILDETFKLISAAWDSDKNGVHNQFIKGVAKFVDLCTNQNKFDVIRIAAKLSQSSPAKIMSLARSRTLSTQFNDEIAIALAETYNKGRTTGSRGKIEIPQRV